MSDEEEKEIIQGVLDRIESNLNRLQEIIDLLKRLSESGKKDE